MSKRVKHNYIDKKKFHVEMTKYRVAAIKAEEDNTTPPQINNYLANCLMMICEKLSYRPNFINYSFREEMVGDAVENCLAAVDNFDPNEKKQNPFGYFSLIAWRAFVRRIQKESKQTYIKHKYYHETGLYDEIESSVNSDPAIARIQTNVSDISNRIIENFESKISTPKQTKKKKGVEKFIDDE